MGGNRHLLDVELVVAGFVNTNKDGIEFTLADVQNYQLSFWNAGVGWVRPDYTPFNLACYLDKCDKVCLDILESRCRWRINKSYLSPKFQSEEERRFLHNNPDLAKAFDLFCRLQVDVRTDRYLLDWTGFRFVYAD